MINLAALPAPEVIEVLDYETEYQELMARFREAMGEGWSAALESDPVVKLLEQVAYERMLMRARINDAARAVLLAHSRGGDLDNLLALLGAERLEGEGDGAFRERGRLAPLGFSTAGPAAAYRYHARSAHPDVADVQVTRPVPGEVQISVLSRVGDGAPAQGLLSTVAAALNAEDVRPLSDTVTVVAARIRPWSAKAVLHFPSGAAIDPVMAEARRAVAAYAAAQHRVGAAVRIGGINAALYQAGVENVELTSLAADIESAEGVAPYCTGVELTAVVDYV